jgi:acyl carrier protein
MDTLRDDIKRLIVDELELEDIQAESIKDSEPLFGPDSRLALDSIDALELGIALKKRYNVKFSGENEEERARFTSVDTLAKYIESQRQGRM